MDLTCWGSTPKVQEAFRPAIRRTPHNDTDTAVEGVVRRVPSAEVYYFRYRVPNRVKKGITIISITAYACMLIETASSDMLADER